MSTLPESWDDVKFIDGFLRLYVALARNKKRTNGTSQISMAKIPSAQ